jgi:hypothetical protein
MGQVCAGGERCGVLHPERWTSALKDALWIEAARGSTGSWRPPADAGVRELPPHLERCPLAALATYIEDNWERLRANELEDQGLDYVSGRAESQVRDRTKPRG